MTERLANADVNWGFRETPVSYAYDCSLIWPVKSKLLTHELGHDTEDVPSLLDAKFGQHLAHGFGFIASDLA